MAAIVGYINDDVCRILNYTPQNDRNIYLGKTNITHITSKHPGVYEKYQNRIPDILDSPDYIKINNNDLSIEYIKSFDNDIKIAVRLSGDGMYYMKSMYIVSKKRNEMMIRSGELKRFYRK